MLGTLRWSRSSRCHETPSQTSAYSCWHTPHYGRKRGCRVHTHAHTHAHVYTDMHTHNTHLYLGPCVTNVSDSPITPCVQWFILYTSYLSVWGLRREGRRGGGEGGEGGEGRRRKGKRGKGGEGKEVREGKGRDGKGGREGRKRREGGEERVEGGEG